jgi:hypothetical protein
MSLFHLAPWPIAPPQATIALQDLHSSTTHLKLLLPYLRGHSHRKPKCRVALSQPPPEPLLPSQTKWAKLTISQLAYPASLPVAESGLRVMFGSLFTTQHAIVFFIHHFWCPRSRTRIWCTPLPIPLRLLFRMQAQRRWSRSSIYTNPSLALGMG